MLEQGRLKFIVPSEGNLYEPSKVLLGEAGITWQNEGGDSEASTPEGRFVLGFRKPETIVAEIRSGNFDMGIAPGILRSRKVGIFAYDLGFGEASLIYNRSAFNQVADGRIEIRPSKILEPLSIGKDPKLMFTVVRSRLYAVLLERGNSQIDFQVNWQRMKYEW